MNKRFFFVWSTTLKHYENTKSNPSNLVRKPTFSIFTASHLFLQKKNKKILTTNYALSHNILHVFSIREKLVKCPYLSFSPGRIIFISFFLFRFFFFWLSCTATHIFRAKSKCCTTLDENLFYKVCDATCIRV